MCSVGFIALPHPLQGEATSGKAASHRVWDVCALYTPLVEPVQGAPQAFVDLTGSRATPELIHALAQRLTGAQLVSGWASSKFVARVAAMATTATGGAGPGETGETRGTGGTGDTRSTGGITRVPKGSEAGFLAPLDVSFLWPVPTGLVDRLRRLGLNRIGLVRQVPLDELRLQLGDYAVKVHNLCNGVDGEPVRAAYPPPVVKASRLFPFDLEPGTEVLAEHEIASALESLIAEAGRQPEVREGRRALVSVSLTLVPGGVSLQRAVKQAGAGLSYDHLHLVVAGLWRSALLGAVARTAGGVGGPAARPETIRGFELELKFAEGAEAASALSGAQEPMLVLRRPDPAPVPRPRQTGLTSLRVPEGPGRAWGPVDPRLARALSGLVLRFGAGVVGVGVGDGTGSTLRSAAGDPEVARRELARAALALRSLGEEMGTT